MGMEYRSTAVRIGLPVRRKARRMVGLHGQPGELKQINLLAKINLLG